MVGQSQLLPKIDRQYRPDIDQNRPGIDQFRLGEDPVQISIDLYHQFSLSPCHSDSGLLLSMHWKENLTKIMQIKY